MFVGKVIGTVWSTVKWPGMSGHKLLLVRPYHLVDLRARADASHAAASPSPSPAPAPAPAGEAVVCIDLLDAGIGDDVVVAFGHAARVAAESTGQAPTTPASGAPITPPTTPIDAAVVAVVDNYSLVSPALVDETVALDGTT